VLSTPRIDDHRIERRARMGWLACAKLSVLLCLAGCRSEETIVRVGTNSAMSGEEVAARIRQTYDSRFFELEERFQSHYTVRIFRATGDTTNLDVVGRDIGRRLEGFLATIDSVNHVRDVEYAGQKEVSNMPRLTETQRSRRELFSENPEFLLHRRILFTAYKINDYGLHEGVLRVPYVRACEHLATVDWASFLLDSEVIRPYAAQTTNMVFWLKQIGVVDLEEPYTLVFKGFFMRSNDEDFSAADYQAKLYGLTHFIIGESQYYQRPVSPEKFAWILDYFDEHILEILTWSKPDIIAEIALCFRLCGLDDHRAVGHAKQFLINAFDPKLGFIPSGGSTVDFNTSEHRNAVAYLVLYDWKELHRGPHLRDGMLAMTPSIRARLDLMETGEESASLLVDRGLAKILHPIDDDGRALPEPEPAHH